MGFWVGNSLRNKWIKTFGKVFFLFFFLIASQDEAIATHENDHRYVVSGYVRDDSGRPRESITVYLEHKGGEKKKVTTSDSGYYEILFHLHNDNIGDEILVKVGETEKKIKVAFDVEDKTSNRGDVVDFGAMPKSSGQSVYLILGALFVGAYALYFGFFRKNKKKALPKKRRGKR